MRVRVAVVTVLLLALASCARAGLSPTALRAYVRAVEPVRLAVNRLLEGADPILDAYREQRITADQASSRMDGLERRFAAYTVRINAVNPADPTLARLHTPYAHTYVLEDAYLSALVSGLASGGFSSLPNTQSQQRAAIIEWRTQLTILAHSTRVRLPADLQQAGRGEIAPAVSGVS